jgi:hypothetical protein
MINLVPCIECYSLITDAEFEDRNFSELEGLRVSWGGYTKGDLIYDVGNIWISPKRERWLTRSRYKIYSSIDDEGYRHVSLPLVSRVVALTPFYLRSSSWVSSVRGMRKLLGKGGILNMYRVFFPDELDKVRELSLYMPMKGRERFEQVIQIMSEGRSICCFAGIDSDLLPGYYVYTDE